MTCRCDIESHGHRWVCKKVVKYSDSKTWESCDHIEIIKNDKDEIENKLRNECFCPKNRCCLYCWDREFVMAKGYLLRYLRGMGGVT